MTKLSLTEFNERLAKHQVVALEEYVDSRKEIKLKCLKCGFEFLSKPTNFIYKNGKCPCPKCSKTKVTNTDSFIVRAREIHNNYYNYSKVQYINSKEKVCIICPEHGEFWQAPNTHLSGKGCPKCGRIKTTMAAKLTVDEFINKANIIYDNKYDYSKVDYTNNHTKVCIICPEHGEFWLEPRVHLGGHGCTKCSLHIPSTIEFIKKANLIHNNIYSYNKVDYINAKTPVTITCSTHGDFMLTPDKHLQGQGCPICKHSKGEKEVARILKKYNIEFLYQHTINTKINNRAVIVDFMLEYNSNIYIIEYNGIQHYQPVEYFGGEEAFKLQIIRDKGLKELCTTNNINFIEIPYTIPFTDIEILLKEKLNIKK